MGHRKVASIVGCGWVVAGRGWSRVSRRGLSLAQGGVTDANGLLSASMRMGCARKTLRMDGLHEGGRRGCRWSRVSCRKSSPTRGGVIDANGLLSTSMQMNCTRRMEGLREGERKKVLTKDN